MGLGFPGGRLPGEAGSVGCGGEFSMILKISYSYCGFAKFLGYIREAEREPQWGMGHRPATGAGSTNPAAEQESGGGSEDEVQVGLGAEWEMA